MKTKKILSIALAILVLIGTFAVGASAAEQEIKNTDIILAGEIVSGTEESYWLTVDGALTADGASASNYNIAITPATEDSATKITLNNAQLSKVSDIGDDTYCAMGSVGDFDIELKGTNKFDILPESEATVYGILSDGTLRIYGNGSLELNTGNEWTVANRAVTGNIIEISDDTKVKLNLKAIYGITGVYFGESIIVSDNAEFEINEFFLENTDAEYTVGEDYVKGNVYANGFYSVVGTAEFTDNSKIAVNMINTDSVKNANQGFDIENDLELSGNSQLTVNGVDGIGCCGIEIKNGALTVKDDASINVKAGNGSDGKSYGIYLYSSYDKEGKPITVSDNAEIIVTVGNAVYENSGIYCEAELIATDNAYISATTGDTSKDSGDTFGVLISDGITLSGKAKLIGKSGNNADENYGISSEYITVNDDAAIEGYAGIGGTSCGIYSINTTAYGNAKLTGESKGSTDDGASTGIYAGIFKAYDNAEINAKGSNGYSSYGFAAEEITVSGSAKITATSGDATGISVGIWADDETLVIADNATVTAKSGKGFESAGIRAYAFDISGNAVVVAEASEAAENSVGIASEALNIKDNVNIKAIGSASDIFSFGILGVNTVISASATVEAAGERSAIFAMDYEFIGFEGAYITVSTDTNPENAVVYNGTDLLLTYEDDEDTLHESTFKYVFIAPEAPAEPELPAEPEPELNFFEQLISDIVEFFNAIIIFFSSLFSFGG